MKKKLKILFLFIVILLLFNIFFYSQGKKNVQIVDRMQKQLKTEAYKNIIFSQLIELQIKSEGTPIGEKNLKDINDSLIQINSLMNNNNLLFVIRYSSISCETCLNQTIELVKEILQPINDKVIFLAKYSSSKDLIEFANVNQLKYPIYNIDEIVTPSDSLNSFYFFCLDCQGNTSKVFIPQESNVKLTRNYLNHICDYIMMKNL